MNLSPLAVLVAVECYQHGQIDYADFCRRYRCSIRMVQIILQNMMEIDAIEPPARAVNGVRKVTVRTPHRLWIWLELEAVPA